MRFLRVVGPALVMSIVFGAGVFANGQQEPDGADGGDVEIRFTWWGSTERHEKYNAIADLFEETHEGVTIVREFGGWADYWDKLATQTAGGNAPDVQGMHLRYIAEYARRDALLPLDDYIEEGVIDLTYFPEPIQEAGRFDGETLMVAQGYTIEGYVYNTAILDDLGVDYPDFDWTWDDFKQKLIEIRDANDNPDFFPGRDRSGNMFPEFNVFVKQRGGLTFTEDGDIGFDVEDAEAWFAMWKEFRDEGLIPDGATTQEYFGLPLEQGRLARGLAAISPMPFNQLILHQNAVGQDQELRLARIPHVAGGQDGEELGASFLGISTSSDHPRVAAEFIDFFVNDEGAVTIFKLEQGALGSTAANEVITPILSPIEQRLLSGIQRAAEHVTPEPLPPAGAGEVIAALEDAAQAVQFGQLSPREAAEQLVSRSRDILSQ